MTGITSSEAGRQPMRRGARHHVSAAFVSTALKQIRNPRNYGRRVSAGTTAPGSKWTATEPSCKRQTSRRIFDIFTQALTRLLIIRLPDIMPSDSDDIIATLNGRLLRLSAQPLQSAASFLSIKAKFQARTGWHSGFVRRKQTNEARWKPAALERKSPVWRGDYERLIGWYLSLEVLPYCCRKVKTARLIKTTH